jgi:NitT/TauT family transport system substrate-binding protein
VVQPIQYGIPTDKEAIQLRLGIERGFFRDEGINLSLRVVFGGPEIARCYESGDLQIGELGSPPATTALSRGARFRIIASSARGRALQYFVAHPSVTDWGSLRGKTVATLSIGSCSYWFMREVLTKHGLAPDSDLSIIGLGERYPRVTELFEAGEIQAAVLSEPNVSIGEDRGVFRIMQALTDAEFCPTMQWSVIVANLEAMAREPEMIRAVLRGCIRSYRYAAAHPDEMADFSAGYFGISPETAAKVIRREQRDLNTEGRIDLEGLREAIALQIRLGAFKEALRVEDIVDQRFLPDATERSAALATESRAC